MGYNKKLNKYNAVSIIIIFHIASHCKFVHPTLLPYIVLVRFWQVVPSLFNILGILTFFRILCLSFGKYYGCSALSVLLRYSRLMRDGLPVTNFDPSLVCPTEIFRIAACCDHTLAICSDLLYEI